MIIITIIDIFITQNSGYFHISGRNPSWACLKGGHWNPNDNNIQQLHKVSHKHDERIQ